MEEEDDSMFGLEIRKQENRDEEEREKIGMKSKKMKI